MVDWNTLLWRDLHQSKHSGEYLLIYHSYLLIYHSYLFIYHSGEFLKYLLHQTIQIKWSRTDAYFEHNNDINPFPQVSHENYACLFFNIRDYSINPANTCVITLMSMLTNRCTEHLHKANKENLLRIWQCES